MDSAGANADYPVLHADAFELVEIADVDQNVRRREPQVQRCDQALSARERHRCRAMPRKQLECLIKARRFHISEIGGFHSGAKPLTSKNGQLASRPCNEKATSQKECSLK